MAYSKTVWNNNTPPDISAENLNKMEQGIADAQFPDGGSTGQILSKTNDGTGWIDAPNSAVWGLIQGTLSDQTDLQNALDNTGKVDTVNGIQPNAQKNVEVDIELTKAEYDALPSSKLTDDVNYWIKDGTNLPQTSVISADGVMYTNSQTVKGALDEQASAISDLNNGLRSIQTLDNFIGYKDRTISNISISSDNGYANLGDVYTNWGLPSGAYVLGFFVRGWSSAPGTFSLASSSDGKTLYTYCAKAGTIGYLSIRVWYAKF